MGRSKAQTVLAPVFHCLYNTRTVCLFCYWLAKGKKKHSIFSLFWSLLILSLFCYFYYFQLNQLREARAPAGREETFWHPLQGSPPTQGFTLSNHVVVVVVFVFVVVDVVVVVFVIVVIGILTKSTHPLNISPCSMLLMLLFLLLLMVLLLRLRFENRLIINYFQHVANIGSSRKMWHPE